MRTLLTLSILTLAFCVGCIKVDITESNVRPVSHQDEASDHDICPYCAPALLEKINEKMDSEALDSPTAGMMPTQGKYAAESVPLPPLDDLTAQIDDYITRIGEAVERLDGSTKYAEDAASVVRDVSALATIALAVGLAEEDSKYKPSASHIIVAARTLAAAKNFDEGKAAFDALNASLTNTSAGTPLAWTDKVADLAPLMQALPNLSSVVNRLTGAESRFNTVAAGANARTQAARQQVLGHLAALAVISQGSIPNVGQTEKPDAVAEWEKYCKDFRDAALKVNAAAHQFIQGRAAGSADFSVYETAFKAMSETCDDCHRTFYPSAVGKTE